MHARIAAGVVDQNCKIHGLANTFIAGGSVFPDQWCGAAHADDSSRLAARLARSSQANDRLSAMATT